MTSLKTLYRILKEGMILMDLIVIKDLVDKVRKNIQQVIVGKYEAID